MSQGHTLFGLGKVTARRYAACGHVVASRRGCAEEPVDDQLQKIGLVRTVVAVVPSFAAALAVARSSDLVTLLPESFVDGLKASASDEFRSLFHVFPVPVRTDPIAVGDTDSRGRTLLTCLAEA